MVDNECYVLQEGDNTIGRHPTNVIYIEHPVRITLFLILLLYQCFMFNYFQSVSMNHAVIQCDSDGVVLVDKGSLNKTKLNKVIN